MTATKAVVEGGTWWFCGVAGFMEGFGLCSWRGRERWRHRFCGGSFSLPTGYGSHSPSDGHPSSGGDIVVKKKRNRIWRKNSGSCIHPYNPGKEEKVNGSEIGTTGQQ